MYKRVNVILWVCRHLCVIFTVVLCMWCSQWSYGVTMWEIFSGGKAPYPGTDPLTLMQRLEEGDRISKPSNAACTDEM